MGESIAIALEVYLVAFAVAVLIAGMIKGMLGVIRKITPKEKMIEEEK